MKDTEREARLERRDNLIVGEAAGEGDEGAYNGGIDGPHVPAESTGEREEGGPEHQWKTQRRSVTAISRAHHTRVDGRHNT